MAPKPHVELATRWLERSKQRELRDEVEYRFRTWIRRQVDAGHDAHVAAGALAQAIEAQPFGHWRYSRELLDDLGDLPPVGEQRLPAETDAQRKRRKKATQAFLGGTASDAELRGADVDEVEAERDDRSRLSDEEREQLNGLMGRQRSARGETGSTGTLGAELGDVLEQGRRRREGGEPCT